MMQYKDLSEAYIGAIIKGVGAPVLPPESIHPDYRQMYSDIQRAGREAVLALNGASKPCVQAWSVVSEAEITLETLLQLLIDEAKKYRVVQTMRNAVERYSATGEIDFAYVLGEVVRSGASRDILIPHAASEIDETTLPVYVKSGFTPLDNTVGGIPTGVTAIVGHTGNGKTAFVTNLVACFLDANPNANVLLITTELPAPLVKQRAIRMRQFEPNDPRFSRMFIVDKMRRGGSAGGIHLAIQLMQVTIGITPDLVVVDYVDGLVRELSQAGFAEAWLSAQEAARVYNVPVVVVSQTNRVTKLNGGLPGIFGLNGTGTAENVSQLILSIGRVSIEELNNGQYTYPIPPLPGEYFMMQVLKATWGLMPIEPSLLPDNVYSPPFLMVFSNNREYPLWRSPLVFEQAIAPNIRQPKRVSKVDEVDELI